MARITPLICVIALVAMLGMAQGQSIYAIVTEFGGQDTETIQYTVRVDLSTGEIENIVQNFIIAGSSETLDGISTFDPTRQVYYYATDFVAPFIYQANVKTATLLPPIYMGGYSTVALLFDTLQSRLLSIVADNKGAGYLVTLPVTGAPSQVYLQFPAVFQFGYISAYALNGPTFYTVIKEGQNTTASYVVAYTDISKPTPSQWTINDMRCPVAVFPEYVAWDNKLGVLTGFGSFFQAGQFFTYFLKISPTSGLCTATQVQVPSGIITAYSYDSTNRNYYLALAPNGPAQILRYNVALGKIDQTTSIKANVVPESIEFSAL